jgi:hypothetical protein
MILMVAGKHPALNKQSQVLSSVIVMLIMLVARHYALNKHLQMLCYAWVMLCCGCIIHPLWGTGKACILICRRLKLVAQLRPSIVWGHELAV